MTIKDHAELHGHEPYMAVATHYRDDNTYVEAFLGWSRNGFAKDLMPFLSRSQEAMLSKGITRAWSLELKPSAEEMRPEAWCGVCGWDPIEAEREVAG